MSYILIQGSDYSYTDDIGFDIFKCSFCEGEILNGDSIDEYKHTYCPHCGKEILWTLEEIWN